MSDIYETEKLLAEYLLFHFGTADEILPPEREWPAGMREALDFPLRTVSYFGNGQVARGLDLGCAVGRSTFEMARSCDEVLGIDFSHAFIRAAESLRCGEAVTYKRLDEATLSTHLTSRAPQLTGCGEVRFLQGDAMHLPDNLGVFDRVHAANLLCRLPEPELLLSKLPALVKTGGELVIATPCTWLEEFTPRGNWPQASTLDWLISSLAPHFELIQTSDEPFLIRETARKFQWTSSLVSVWRRF